MFIVIKEMRNYSRLFYDYHESTKIKFATYSKLTTFYMKISLGIKNYFLGLNKINGQITSSNDIPPCWKVSL